MSKVIPSVSMRTAGSGASTKANELGMRTMQERAYEHRGEQYLLIKSPPASGKSRALMFIALDKLHNQNVRKAIIVVPERSIGGSFADEPLSKYGFWADWEVKPQWNLCNVAGIDNSSVAKSKVKAVGQFLASDDRVLVCTHATFRFAVEELGVEAFDDCLIAVDEFHHVSANPDNKLGAQLGQFLSRVVATYKLFNINRAKLEHVLHRVLSPARLDLTIKDRFGNPVKPEEWYLVPLHVIDEVVEKVKDGSITEFEYDPAEARLRTLTG